ncbi:hypothetical protein FB476_0946 [Ornithinimicrobium humiphilum]|uniref:Uncharacterized protein n=1 Tax=Ornithinimicrobium humiphilum TaxID=125288 RepID=A0A543KLZ2_9MICO|nr:hypothetical protein FB476_0946 [Ornithinimicrobium humiphilum]
MAVVDELLSSWEAHVETGEHKLRSRQRKTLPQAAVVLALTSHVYECAKFLRPHLPTELSPVQMPIVRAILESAMTVLWVDKVEDAAAAFLNEEIRQRNNLQNTLRETPWFAAHADQVAHAGDDPQPTSAAEEARRFNRLLERLGAQDFYAFYRLLSAVTHPSVTLTDCYLEGDDGRGFPFTLMPRAERLSSSEGNAWLMAVCMLWTARTVNYYDGDKQRRSQLRRLGRDMGIKVDFQPR